MDKTKAKKRSPAAKKKAAPKKTAQKKNTKSRAGVGTMKGAAAKKAAKRKTTVKPSARSPSTTLAPIARSPAQTEASRENGAKGGRPENEKYLEDFVVAGPMPEGVLEKIAWAQTILAICLQRIITGRNHPKTDREIRATVGAMGRNMPPDAIAEASRIVREENLVISSDGEGPDVVTFGPMNSIVGH